MPKTNNVLKSRNTKTTEKPASVSFLPSSIPEKSLRKVRNLTKFFKKNNLPKEKKSSKKLYAQASSARNIIRKTLKIKKVFSKLHTSKIKNIQKIISQNNKLKPQTNMTTRGLSRNQVIIPMN